MGGFTSLLLLLCVGSWCSEIQAAVLSTPPSSQSTGTTFSTVLDLQRRIIVDHTCKVNERPYHVKLKSKKWFNELHCGGSLVNTSWILTAAHCWERGRTIWAEVGQERSVKITAKPEIYKDHDIMLLRLPDSTQGNHIIELPDCGQQPAENEKVYVAGHGPSTPGSKKSSKTLQCADMTVSPCVGVIKHPEPEKYMFCGKTPQGQTPVVKICDGDSGGGVEYNGQIYGVISAAEKPDVCYPAAAFLKVCEYIDWIDEIIKK